ncbi:MAG: type II toxin-antitoxin system RelE/ParE family toxin [Clostridiales bacterium]|nr:type II toxin-antitoxin system RelE/ParE family toxin [Clostridiales bacterium]
MKHDVEYTDLSKSDLKELEGSQAKIVIKAIGKVSENPLAKNQGGYGTPLGNKHGRNLTGLYRIKLLKLGIRIVYQLVREGKIMKIIVIAARADDEVYDIAAQRSEKD